MDVDDYVCFPSLVWGWRTVMFKLYEALYSRIACSKVARKHVG